jgi:hypothetical protein
MFFPLENWMRWDEMGWDRVIVKILREEKEDWVFNSFLSFSQATSHVQSNFLPFSRGEKPLKRVMTGVLLEEGGKGRKEGGCNNFWKGCFLSCMGREVWLFSKVGSQLFTFVFLHSSNVFIQHWSFASYG